MIKKLDIKNLRGIASGTLDDLALVNVVVGPNNAGKSTLLDALLLGVSPNPSEIMQKVLRRRSLADPNAWLLYRRKEEAATECSLVIETDHGDVHEVLITANHNRANGQVSLSAVWPEEKLVQKKQKELAVHQRSLQAKRQTDPTQVATTVQEIQRLSNEVQQLQSELQRKQQKGDPVPGTPQVHLIEPEFSDKKTPLHDLYTQVAERGLRSHAKQIVMDMIPELDDIVILTPKSKPVVYLDMRDGGALPVSVAGDGVRLLLTLSFELATPEGGLVLLEEPETHLHPAAIRQAARAIHAASGRGIQIVLTTHSLDMIDSLLETFGNDLDRLAFYRARLDQGKLLLSRHTGQEAAVARTEIEEDLR